MLMNQSFFCNLLVLFALCVLLIDAAPVKVRRSGAPGSSQGELPRLPRRMAGQPFAPYRAYKKRQALSFTSAASSSLSVSVSTKTSTQTRTIISTRTISFTTTASPSPSVALAAVPTNVVGDLSAALGAALGAANPPPELASFLSAALGAAITSAAPPTPTTAKAVPPVPSAIASLIASELSVALNGASVPPALASQFSSALGAALGSATPSASASSVSSASTPASVSSKAPLFPVPVSSARAKISSASSTVVVKSTPTPSATQATATTVTITVGNVPTAIPIVAGPPGGQPSSSSAGAKCKETNVFNQAELHPNPRKNIALYKAVPNDPATLEALITNPNPPRNEKGDFSNTGAFYLTDTWQAAAQAACYGSGRPQDSVAVIQYKWNPEPDTKIIEFSSANTQWRTFINTKQNQFVTQNDMIAGPAEFRKDITTTFWQYAVNSDKGMQDLDLAAVYQPIFCKDIPRGNCLPLV